MRAERLLAALDSGKPAFGTAVHSPDPAIVEIAAIAGHDWVSIILEHCALTLADVGLLQRAADSRGISTVVHMSNAYDTRILPLLNEGVGGVVAPQVTRPEEASALVRAARFPPYGERGAAGGIRSADYGGRPISEHLASADESIVVGVILESHEAATRADEILAVQGLTFAYIGLTDLSHSVGAAGDFKHPRVRAAIETIVGAAHRHGVVVGLSEYGYTVEELLGLGARMIITPTSEYSVLLGGFSERLATARAMARAVAEDV
jgi:4-hydroxy-2-oxoheptanedioate aldolase